MKYFIFSLFILTSAPFVSGQEIRNWTSSFTQGKGVEISIISTTTVRAPYTNYLIEADFIGSIRNNNEYNIESTGVNVHVLDCKRNTNKCTYRGYETMWINVKLKPGEYKQFKRRVFFYPALKIEHKPSYELDIIGVVR